MTVGMLRHRPRMAGARNRRAVVVVAQRAVDAGKAVVDRAPDRDFPIRLEQRMEIVLEVGQQKSADPGGFEQPHVSGLPAGKVDMRVERHAGTPQDLIHVGAPDFALEAAVQRRGGRKRLRPAPNNLRS